VERRYEVYVDVNGSEGECGDEGVGEEEVEEASKPNTKTPNSGASVGGV
jgi:hypothetical protein